jgi:hypothetical protein
VTSALSRATPQAPRFVCEPTPELNLARIGLSSDARFYRWSDTFNRDPSPEDVYPALRGLVHGVSLATRGAGSQYGARPFVDVTFDAGDGEGFVLCLAAGKPDQVSWPVRSLLGALSWLDCDLPSTILKLQPKAGERANFIQAFPYTAGGQELPEIRAEAIGGSTYALEVAVNRLRKILGQAPAADPDTSANCG